MTKSGVGIGRSRFKRGAGRAQGALSDTPACGSTVAPRRARPRQTRLARVERT